ncbi:hypothetical protein [Algibacter mikhailovii]|uniref:hypothetical protein n=1 Tax=Algibacter mikhailovii TaxID=425498 RepID=UPI0024947A49|nr:hypothetical protein [Algibacter mikhailovii]
MKTFQSILRFLFFLLVSSSFLQGQEENHEIVHDAHESNQPIYKLDSQRAWPFFSFLNDPGDDASTLGLEFESTLKVGKYNVKNISYFEVNQYPRPIPGQPVGNPIEGGNIKAVDGINDLLMGFWFTKREAHHGKHHLALGFAAQLPTAADPSLGSGQWSIGPSFDYEYENGRLFAGAIALQLWSFAGSSQRKDVNMLMIKPFIVYNIAKRFDLIYMPYGVSVYWNKPSSEAVYLPLGGGGQYQFPLGKTTTLNTGVQCFKNVIRPTKGTVYDLRFLVEFVF